MGMGSNWKSLLVKWGVDIFTKNFVDEGITDESFVLLDEETIKILIPKLGPRLLFKTKYKKYMETSPQVEPEQEETSQYPDYCKSEVDDEFDEEDLKPLMRLSEEKPEKPDIPQLIWFNKGECSSKTEQHKNSSPVFERVLLNEEWNPSKPQFKITVLNGDSFDEQPLKKKKVESIFPDGLESVLNEYPDGQIVLSHRKKLTNEFRSKLTKTIITELYRHFDFNEVTSKVFIKISKEIEDLFPAESAQTYYIPYNKTTKKGPKGKLYTKFVSTKSSLKGARSISAKTKKKNIETENLNSESENLDEEKTHLELLKVASEPKLQISKAWEASFKIRRRKYLNASLSQLYDELPCLKKRYALELIESDFNKRYSDKTDIIYTTWPTVSQAILTEMEERKIASSQYSGADIATKTLLQLPYLFNPITVKKSKGLTWRASRSEVQDSFFCYLKDEEEIEGHLAKKRKKYESLCMDSDVQPYAAIVGDVQSPRYLIVTNEFSYDVDSGIRCLELLFKLFHGLDIDYPTESSHLWILIEQLFFKMTPKVQCPAVATLVTDLTYRLPV